MGVEFTHYFADDSGRFLVRFVGVERQFVAHTEKYTPVDRFETVSYVGGARDTITDME